MATVKVFWGGAPHKTFDEPFRMLKFIKKLAGSQPHYRQALEVVFFPEISEIFRLRLRLPLPSLQLQSAEARLVLRLPGFAGNMVDKKSADISQSAWQKKRVGFLMQRTIYCT